MAQPKLRLARPEIEPQISQVRILKAADRLDMPPVFGTTCPPRGLSGLIRIGAYKISEARLSHWLLLFFADRVDRLEGRLPQMKGGALLASIGLSAALLPVVGPMFSRIVSSEEHE